MGQSASLRRGAEALSAACDRDGSPGCAKFPKAVKEITDDVDELLAFYDFPAEHWIHLRTPNPIESTFATVRLRTKVTRGAGSSAAALRQSHRPRTADLASN